MKQVKTMISVYGWLILAMLFLFLAGGDRPVEIAVWLSPIFLLRFFRETQWWKGVLISLPFIAAVTTLADKGMMPFPFSVAVILTVINSTLGLIPFITDRLLRRSLPLYVRTLLFPFVAVSVEFFLASHFTGGTWGNIAYDIQNLALLQLISVTGIWGIMFLIYWTASVINEIWEHRHNLYDVRKLVAVFLVIFMGVYGFGLWRLSHRKPAEYTVRVAGLTPGPGHRAEMMNIFGKIFSPKRTEIFDEEAIRTSINKRFHQLLMESAKLGKSGIKLVVWSEGATFIFERDERIFIQDAIRSAEKYDFFLGMALAVLKDSCLDLCANGQPFMTNKLMLISPAGQVDWEYAKWNRAPGFEKAMTIRGDGILKLSKTTMGDMTGAICYDMDFPAYIRQAGVLRSDLILVPSNDWPEIKHTHAKMARMRAIENGAALIRPASNGHSIAVDPYGNIVSIVDDIQSNGVPLVAALPVGSVRTLYAMAGDFWVWISLLGGLFLIVFGVTGKIKRT